MRIAFLSLLALASSVAFAQQHAVNRMPGMFLDRGMELYQEGRYNAAIAQFEHYLGSELSESRLDEAEFYLAMSKLKAGHVDGEVTLLQFLDRHPGSIQSNEANVALGDYEYEKPRYRSALRYYKDVDAAALSPDDRNRFAFRRSNCYLSVGEYDKAAEGFKPLTQTGGEYKDLAQYYYAYAELRNQHYQEAIEAFKAVRDLGYARVSFYIAQIYYQLDNYPSALAELEKPQKGVDRSEVEMLKAKCNYRLQNYPKAAEAFLAADPNPESLSTAEQYEIGYSLYKSGSFTESLPWLRKVAAQGDSISQMASFSLGNALLKLKNYREAQTAYGEAYRSGYNKEIAELALFNQAKLAVQLSDPNNIALLDRFVKLFPRSANAKEATKLKARLLLETDSYREAVALLDQLDNLDAQTEMLYQRVTLNRGKELYKARDFSQAIELFEKCSSKKADKAMAAESRFWIAEANGQMGNVAESQNAYLKFLDMSGASEVPEFAYAYYGLGYISYKDKLYARAAQYFDGFTDRVSKGRYDERLVQDAYLRSGDCHFMAKELDEALKAYAYVTGKRGADADYALFQSSLIYGLKGNAEEKITTLKRLTTEYSASRFLVDAYSELAAEYMILDQPNQAVKYLEYVVQQFPNNLAASRAYSTLGRLYYNQERIEDAVNAYTQLYDKYPGTPEAKAAAQMVKGIYQETGRAPEYVKWAKNRGGIRFSEQDSLLYETAYALYEKSQYQQAINSFESYLKEQESGAFVINANYFKAICHETLGQPANALVHYKKVAKSSSLDYKEDALLATLKILGKDAKCEDIVEYVIELEAITKSRDTRTQTWTSLLYCYQKLGKTEELELLARKVMDDPGVSGDLRTESELILAKSHIRLGKTEMAKAALESILGKDDNRFAAEAQFRLGELYYNIDSLELCKEACYAVLDRFNGYDYWVGKSLILLGDAFLKEGDEFNAQATWNVVIESFGSSELAEQAQRKVQALGKP